MKLRNILIMSASVIGFSTLMSCNDTPPRIMRPVSDLAHSETFPNADSSISHINNDELHHYRPEQVEKMFKLAEKAGENIFTNLYSWKSSKIITQDTLKRFVRANDGNMVIICYDVLDGNFTRFDVDLPGYFAYRYAPDLGYWYVYTRGSNGKYSPVIKNATLKSGSGIDVEVTPTVSSLFIGDDHHDTVKNTWNLLASHSLETMTPQERSMIAY